MYMENNPVDNPVDISVDNPVDIPVDNLVDNPEDTDNSNKSYEEKGKFINLDAFF